MASRIAAGSGSRVALQQRLRGEQHARRAEAALERVLRAERPLERRRSRRVSATPSIVSTRQPSAWAASIRQPRTGVPSTPHRARAAHAVLAADVRAGEPELVAEKVDQVLPRPSTSRVDRRAVDGQRDLHERASTSRPTTRASSTRARWRRRAGEPCTSPGGSRSPSSARPPRRASPRRRAGRPARPRRAARARAACRHRRTRAAARRWLSPVTRSARGQARQGEVAVATRQLVEPPAPPRGARAAPGSR